MCVCVCVCVCVHTGSNQIDTFLKQHGGPGIQHIGLHTNDIVSTARTMAEAGVQFFSPPPTYYTEVCMMRSKDDLTRCLDVSDKMSEPFYCTIRYFTLKYILPLILAL